MTGNGIDDDLAECLQVHPQSFSIDDIDRVLGVVQEERYEMEYWWLLALNDGRPALLGAWHNCTGWDGESGANSAVASAPYGPWYCGSACDSFTLAHPDEPISRDVIDELARQEQYGLQPTRREHIGKALFGAPDAT